jgi:hypothetical protein
MPLPPIDGPDISQRMEVCQIKLGMAQFDHEYQKGQCLSFDELLALAKISEHDEHVGLN